jgi:hypothetical protein
VVADASQAKYPAIRVDITRLGSEKLLQRVITEGRAGSHFFDAVTNSGMEIHLLGKMGLLARHAIPEFSSFMADSRDPAGRWADMLFESALGRLQHQTGAKGQNPSRYEDLSTRHGKVKSVFPKDTIPGSPPC